METSQSVLEGFEGTEGVVSSHWQAMRDRYFSQLHGPGEDPVAERQLVQMVLDEARRMVAHPAKLQQRCVGDWALAPEGDLSLEDSLDEDPSLSNSGSIRVEWQEDRVFDCVAMLDCSSSMSGEKHLLGSLAVAVFQLEISPLHSSVVTFNTQSEVIKAFRTPTPVEGVVRDFLKVRPKGFTNIYAGLSSGLGELQKAGRKRVGLIVTDGRSTEGGDPIELARSYDFLAVLHIDGPGSFADGSEQMARAGSGICLKVEEFSELPRRMYEAVRFLARRG